MAIGDGIRRDIAKVTPQERARFIDAIVKLDTTKFFPDGVSYWDKQEDIHKNAHFHGVDVHGGPGFIPWHRVIVNRLEQLLREVDPALSLHYWDWTTDPRVGGAGRAALFTPEFMGNASGDAGHLLNNFESSEDAELGNGHKKIWRDVGATAANPDGTPNIASDDTILAGGDFAAFSTALKQAHDFTAHSYIGGTISDAHYSFHDPFVFLLHSNLDRLWAKWASRRWPRSPEVPVVCPRPPYNRPSLRGLDWCMHQDPVRCRFFMCRLRGGPLSRARYRVDYLGTSPPAVNRIKPGATIQDIS